MIHELNSIMLYIHPPLAIIGYLFASMIAIILGFFYIKGEKPGKKITKREIVSFSYPVILFSVLMMLLLNIDTFFVKGLIPDSDMTGFYVSAKILSTILLSLI